MSHAPPAAGRAPDSGPADSRASGAGDDHSGRDADDRWLATVMNTAFLALLAGSLLRYLLKHPDSPRLPWVVGLGITLAVLQLAGHRLIARRPGRPALVLLGAIVTCWVVIVLLAPSFAWCAVPLIYTVLRTLPTRAAVALVGVLCALVMIAEWRISDDVDPNLFLVPPAVTVLATAVFLHMRRQAERLAATERREGTLAERERLSMEIHDTLAQSLSSQQMLLQAAERTWDSDPATARGHVRTAESIAERSLAEARRFVHDLAPADLAEGGGLAEALRTLALRESTDALRVRLHLDGTPVPLPDRVQSALLRIAQGALANVTEHAGASTATLTLSHLDDQVVLDIADDGHGFAPPTDAPSGGRGHGLAAMRARVRQLGGTLTIESAPGEGTVVSASIPLEDR
ncbi:sensor histidine kinase [Streptomyces sp. NPDC008141]|uniref:sensor histidine kinase n=1 Tax=Streptomyces sp. NPDC008141 TaxID=3364815 RepID=UPI0036F0CCC6